MERTPIGKLKTKSLIAIVIMFFVLLAAGMATYSWYIVSTAPKVRAVETYMAVIDPMLSIARATDEYTVPDEIGNDVTALPEDKQDITWGTKITTYGDNTLQVDFPATMLTDAQHPDGVLSSAASDEGGRLKELEPLAPGIMGDEEDANGYKLNGVRYYKTSDGKICAIGLGVWVRINQDNKDLVAALSNVTFKDAAGNETISVECVGAAIKVVADEYGTDRIIPCKISENKADKTHYCTVYEKDKMPFNANHPVLLELIIYIEGDSDKKTSTDPQKRAGVIGADVETGLCVNIEKITFYDNADFDKSDSE